MGDDNHQQSRHRARVPNPQPYDESSKDLRYLKKWFNRLKNYTMQNDEFLAFFEGGEHETWNCKRDDKTYGLVVEPRPAVANGAPEITADQARIKTQTLRRDLEALLLIFAEYVPLGYYDMVLEQATSINSIFEMMSTSMQLSSENQHILNSHKIKYGDVQDDNAEKLYLRLRAHYALAAPKAGAKFGGKDIEEDVKINELCELMLVEKTLEKIDHRLPSYVQANKGYLFDEGKSLFCVKRLLWNQVDAMVADINKEEEKAGARQALVRFGKEVNKRNQKRQQSTYAGSNINKSNNNNYSKSTARVEMMMCGHCFRAQKPQTVYSTHNIQDCNYLSRDQKMRLLGSMARSLDVDEHEGSEEENIEDLTDAGQADL